MDIQIKYDEKNQPIGWDIKAETDKEIDIVNNIRNLQFFGFNSSDGDDTTIVYNGRTEEDDANNDAGRLHWIQKRHKKS